MKQLIQSLKSGVIAIVVPSPSARHGDFLIRTRATLIYLDAGVSGLVDAVLAAYGFLAVLLPYGRTLNPSRCAASPSR